MVTGLVDCDWSDVVVDVTLVLDLSSYFIGQMFLPVFPSIGNFCVNKLLTSYHQSITDHLCRYPSWLSVLFHVSLTIN